MKRKNFEIKPNHHAHHKIILAESVEYIVPSTVTEYIQEMEDELHELRNRVTGYQMAEQVDANYEKKGIYTLRVKNDEMEDVLSLMSLGLDAAMEKHADSPEFLNSCSALYDRVWKHYNKED